MRTGRLRRIGAACALGAALLTRGAQAQQSDPWNFRAPELSRRQLEEMVSRYEAATESPAYSEALRARARSDAESVRTRLREGDLRVGDRLRLSVEGPITLSDTLSVVTGRIVLVQGVGSVPLAGALRSEVEARLADRVGLVYRGAVVRVRLLTRLWVAGAVGRPGLLALPGDALLDDALSAAGGPITGALLNDMYIERGLVRIVPADSLSAALRSAITLAEIGVENGDRLVVPARGTRDLERLIRTVSFAVTLPFGILALTRLF